MKCINLTQDKFSLVDDNDYEFLNQWKWCISSDGYAMRSVWGKKPSRIYMHRLINNTPQNMHTDHINRNKLDNRRENLRSVTYSQNVHNRDKLKNNTSGYTGVIWNKARKKWLAVIEINKKRIDLGAFTSIQAAWLARRWGEKEYHLR